MSVFRRLEDRLEGLVRGVFSRAFSSEVQPIELAAESGVHFSKGYYRVA